MVFIRLKTAQINGKKPDKKKKVKDVKRRLDEDEARGSSSYQPHIVDHSVSIFLKDFCSKFRRCLYVLSISPFILRLPSSQKNY